VEYWAELCVVTDSPSTHRGLSNGTLITISGKLLLNHGKIHILYILKTDSGSQDPELILSEREIPNSFEEIVTIPNFLLCQNICFVS